MQIIFTNLINTINNSRFLSVLISSILVLLGICFTIYIIKLLSNIRHYIVNRSNSFYLNNLKLQSTILTTPERIDVTNSVLDLITFMINNEIASVFKQYISLNELYNISNIDKDAKTIAENVHNGIDSKLFTDPNVMLTSEYLMTYITKKTIDLLIVVAQNHNDSLRSANQSNGD